LLAIAVGASALLLILSFSAVGSHLYTPAHDISSQKSLDVAATYETLHLDSGGTLTFFVMVTEKGFPVEGATVNFTSDMPDSCVFVYEGGALTDVDGRAVVLMKAHSDADIIMNITARAYLDGYMPGYCEIDQITVEAPEQIINNKDISYISITGLIAVLIIASTEAGKYGMFKTFFLPLYSRLKKDDLLDHFVRGQIYGFIQSHPGEHYNHIKQALDVTNGTLSHHLRALEIQGFVRSQRDGTYKRFYPTDMKVPRTKGIQLSDLQIAIVDAIRQSPGISQKEIARREGISQQTVSYNLSVLGRMGILDVSREGMRKRYYITAETSRSM
jgi:predicted transcriptional regulator